ncbi:polymeric immunoglobulin receptor-like [Leptodactylus fuscus]|uniref:polymeric immunoglobulin receptor-like n=1 Tax=Leptodactylus fuscus TaxID=238119 RepID=UPI003F4EE86D
MGRCTLLLAALALLCPGLISAYRATGVVGDKLVLPCFYPITKHTSLACWGRGSCSNTGCNYPVVTINGTRVVWAKSRKYQVNANMETEDLPLTISDLNQDDSGVYCCRVKVPDLGMDLKREIDVEIQHPMKSDNLVQGSVDDTMTLPCKYSVSEGVREVCWGKGSCPISGCKNKILSIDENKEVWSESSRYKLLGNVANGDVSLTISGLSKDQEGTYCCRVRIPGPFNDDKKEIKLEIKDVNLIKGSVKDKLVLPCSYSTDSGTYKTCWGRGRCGLLSCHNTILESDGDTVTWKESNRYDLTGNLGKGNVSLTIDNANADDGGFYCCRVKVQGFFNDLRKEIRVEIRDADRISGRVGSKVRLPCHYNVSEGTSPMCWGRGPCPLFKCSNTIVSSDGDSESWTESDKYKLMGKMQDGDVSLSIHGVTKEDEGTYCCRVELPGIMNDKMKDIYLEVQDDGFQTIKN